MSSQLERDLVLLNPVTGATVGRLTTPAARENLLVHLLRGSPEVTAAAGPSSVTPVSRGRGRQPAWGSLLVAAGVVTVVGLSAVGLSVDGGRDSLGQVSAAAPDTVRSIGCDQTVPAGEGRPVGGDLAGMTMCVQVALGAGTAGDPRTARSTLTLPGGPPSTQVAILLSPVDPPAKDGVVLLSATSDNFPTDVTAADNQVREVHQVVGLAGDEITDVTVLLADGTTVQALLTEGVWAAAWPVADGGPDDARLRATTADGTRTTRLDDVALPASDPLAPFHRTGS